mmetsp:Transcript_778/g.932  ORF Transcript_778/g.932 Transcript_778/m.932 type:complete len:588 (+) Transcript_778:321-2084(+)
MMGKGSGSGKGAILQERPAHSLNRSLSIGLDSTREKTALISPKGFQNVGNSCYANAALQCLLSTSLTHALLQPAAMPALRDYSSNRRLLEYGTRSMDSSEEVRESRTLRMSRKEKRRKQRKEKRMYVRSDWLRRHLTVITREYVEATPQQSSWFYRPRTPIVDPSSITKHPNKLSKCLTPYQQEDAHEFMRALLSTLTMNGQNKNLSSLFDGLLESAVTCQICRHSSITRDRYMDLSLDIVSGHVNTVGDALCEFTKTELLDCDNKVFCENCNRKQQVAKGLRLATAPSILVCHLKRFAFNDYGRMIRLSKHLRFPLKLEIGEYMSLANKAKPPPYELVGVLVHKGKSCDSGHYLAYVKFQNEWYKANDSVITKVDLDSVLSQQAYILMYEVAGMRSTTMKRFPTPLPRTREYNEIHRDIHEAPMFDKSQTSNNNSSMCDMLCGVSEVNELLFRDMCLGKNPIVKVSEVEIQLSCSKRGRNSIDKVPISRRGKERIYYDFDDPADCENTTLGDDTVYTTDSSQFSLLRSNSGGNLRHYEKEASRAYQNSKPRTQSESRKKRSHSAHKQRNRLQYQTDLRSSVERRRI